MKKPFGNRRGAGTLAVARGRFCRTRPRVVVRTRDEPGFNRIVLDVSNNFLKLALVSDPVIVGFGLPKRLPRPAQHLVGFPSAATFQRAKQSPRLHLWLQKYVDMVGHNHPSSQVVVTKIDAAAERVDDYVGDILPAKVQGASPGGIQVTIHPDKGLSGSQSGRRISTLWQAALQMPGYEEPLAFQINMRETPAGFGHIGEWVATWEVLLSKFATTGVPSRQARVPAPRSYA